MPTKDFIDIGDVLDFEYLRGEIITLNESNDTCTVKIGSAVFNALIFYHCEPDSVLRSNGAIQDGATGFVIGDQVVVMKKKVESPALADVKVIGHVSGCRHCVSDGDGYFVFYNDGDDLKIARCNFAESAVTVSATKYADELKLENWASPYPVISNPFTWNIKKFRHNVMRNGVRVESDLYYIHTSLYFWPNPYSGWTAFCASNPSHPLVTNNLNTEITHSAKLMTDLQTVNYNVNHAHTYQSDPAGNDNWKILTAGQSGDCEDFALTKAQALLDLGYPASALHIECSEISAPDEGTRTGHAWLVVQTTAGDYALDLNSDSVGFNAALTFGGKEFICRRRQIGSNWAFISSFAPVSGCENTPLGYNFNYIFDPLLNILYPLPQDSYVRPFSAPCKQNPSSYYLPYDKYYHMPSAPSINFSEDNDWIYYLTPYGAGTLPTQRIYKFRLNENELYQESVTDVPTVNYDGSHYYASIIGFIQRDGTILSAIPAAPPEANGFGITEIPYWWWCFSAEVISPDGYYDYQYQYYDWVSWPVPPIQE